MALSARLPLIVTPVRSALPFTVTFPNVPPMRVRSDFAFIAISLPFELVIGHSSVRDVFGASDVAAVLMLPASVATIVSSAIFGKVNFDTVIGALTVIVLIWFC